MRITKPAGKLILITVLFGAQACGREAPDPSPGTTTAMSREQCKADWAVWPQLDPTLTCAGRCGLLAVDPSASTYCGCDDACAAAQDCCTDKPQACDPPPPTCDYSDPDRDWVIKDWPKCAVASMVCPAGTKFFEKPGCGCGCEKEPPPTCDYADPDRDWVIKDWPKCFAARIGCPSGWRPFQEVGCGCGCEQEPPPSCDYADPRRDYFAQQPGGCATMLISCEPGWELFDDACGCGCEDKVPACIRALIAQLGSDAVASPPASITLFEYQGQRVYFLPQRCCDIPSAVYDEQCHVICAPDGGFTGAGDGRCPDFFQTATSLGQIWKDPR